MSYIIPLKSVLYRVVRLGFFAKGNNVVFSRDKGLGVSGPLVFSRSISHFPTLSLPFSFIFFLRNYVYRISFPMLTVRKII